MTRTRALAIGLVLAALAVPVAGCGDDEDAAAPGTTTTETTTDTATSATDTGAAPAAGGILAGTVGPGFDISLETNGAIRAGSYELTVDDLSSAHNFHLSGPGVDVTTSVSGEGSDTFTVELVPGTYEFVCDVHASSMSGSLAVEG